jgi:hypothetical protein
METNDYQTLPIGGVDPEQLAESMSNVAYRGYLRERAAERAAEQAEADNGTTTT